MSLNNTHFQDTMIAAVMTGTVGTATTGIVTAASNLINQVDAMIIGFIGSFLANITANLLVYIRVDDAVGATCVHGQPLLPFEH